MFVEARRQGEHTAARHFAEEAARIAPHTSWAGTALFDYQCQAGDWQGALATLTANADARIVDAATAKRLRAVLLTARAMELEGGHPDEARTLAVEAHRLAPDLAPAATTAARLLTRAGEIGRATRLLEAAWKAAPHPEIAEAYAEVRPGDSVRDRLKRVRRLADLRPNHPEAALAVARAAIDAHEWQTARNALGGLTRAEPSSERVCLLMAEIEEGEHGDQGRVRAWLRRALDARPDPVWTADGHVFDHWAPVSPISGRVDAFEWRVVADHAPRPRAAVEMEARMKPAALGPVATKPEEAAKEARVSLSAQPETAPAKPAAGQPKQPPPPAEPAPAARREGGVAEKTVVQPLPDDPGPMAMEGDEERPFGIARGPTA